MTLASYVALAAILPLTVHAWAESEGQRSTEGALDRYRLALETGGTDALRAMFDCHPDPQPSVAVRVIDERSVELFRASSDDASNRVAAGLTDKGPLHPASHDAPEGWHVAAVAVSQGRELEVVLHDESAPRLWGQARAASLVMLACGLAFAIVGAFVITRRALRPIGDLARATQGIVDSGDLGLARRDARNERQSRPAGRALQSHARAKRGARPGDEGVARQRRPRSAHTHGAAPGRRGARACAMAGTRLTLREALAETIEESDRVLGMLTTLMDITEAETGAMRLHKSSEDLAAIAREAIDLYDLVSSERGVHIVTRLAPGVIVSVDRARIRQVCANLIDNAVKYTAPGGRVEVTVTSEEATGIVSIADTGMGISPEDRPRVWDRLYRGDRSRTERGLGLGLSLVKAVVEAHGGEVRLQSEVGVGSTFEVRLPRTGKAGV